MLNREPKRQQAARETAGISAYRNSLYWSMGEGLLLAVVPLLAVLVFVLLLRQPGLEQAMIQRVTTAHAQERATALSNSIASLRQRAHAALQALPTASAAEQSVDTSAVTAALAQALKPSFPEAEALRLLRLSDMGTAELDEDSHSLRNHIEVDLLRRALNGEAVRPEAYRVEGEWLISMAVASEAKGAAEHRHVLLLSFTPRLLEPLLKTTPTVGSWAVEQRYVGQRGANTTVFAGQLPNGAEPVRSSVAQSEWTLLFAPDPALLTQVSSGMRPPLLALSVVLLATLAGFGWGTARYARTLRAEAERVADAAQHRTPLQIGVPELVPLARELRKLTLRRARMDQMGSVPRVLGGDSPMDPAHAPAMSNVQGPASDMAEHIFRAYDIRGVAATELDDQTVYRIGAAIGTLAGIQGEQTLVLGYDGRASSGRIKALVEKALLQSGRDVIDIGLVPTPLLYFATHQLDASSGIMITGSHNPPEYNGMKIVLNRQSVDSTLIEKIRRLALSGKFSTGTGHLIQRDVISDYLDEVVGDIAVAVPLRVVVDAGNGATGHIAPTLFEELGCEVIPLFCEVDGRFPNRSPDTGDERNLASLVASVIDEKADLGIAFDGDGDRIAVVTGSGAIVRADLLLMLFARDVVARNPGADVIYDVKCTRNLAQLITSLGGRAVLWKTGHALMKQKMAETGALLGGEFSGHMFFGERWYGFDDGMYAAGRLIEILSTQELELDALVAQLPAAVGTPEILLPIAEEQKFALMERFRSEAHFPEGKVNELDGVRVDFRDGWGLLRASNTAAVLTARFEAVDEASLERIMSLFRDQLAVIDPHIDLTF